MVIKINLEKRNAKTLKRWERTVKRLSKLVNIRNQNNNDLCDEMSDDEAKLCMELDDMLNKATEVGIQLQGIQAGNVTGLKPEKDNE